MKTSEDEICSATEKKQISKNCNQVHNQRQQKNPLPRRDSEPTGITQNRNHERVRKRSLSNDHDKILFYQNIEQFHNSSQNDGNDNIRFDQNRNNLRKKGEENNILEQSIEQICATFRNTEMDRTKNRP